jgi:hypothetical protein
MFLDFVAASRTRDWRVIATKRPSSAAPQPVE